MRTSIGHLCIYLFLLILFNCAADLAGCTNSDGKKNLKEMKTEVNIVVGDKVICRSIYENIEDPGHGPSHRTVTEIFGIVEGVRESEFQLKVQSVGLSRYRLKNEKWISALSLLRGPPVREGDDFVCRPRNEIQRRSASKIRQKVTIEKLSSR